MGIDAIITIAAAIGDPAGVAAIGHRHRHLVTARRGHMTERRLRHDLPQRRKQVGLKPHSEAAQQHGTVSHRFTRRLHIGNRVE